MTDLAVTLPTFPADPYLHLLPALDRHHVSTADLVTLDAVALAKRTQLPVLDLRRLCKHVVDALHQDLRLGDADWDHPDKLSQLGDCPGPGSGLSRPGSIDTLDAGFNEILGGGVPFGYVSEVTGERYVTVSALSDRHRLLYITY